MQAASDRLLAYTPVDNKLLASLEANGYAIEKVVTPGEYLSAVELRMPDLALLPLTYPESETLLSALVGRESHPPVLVFGEGDQAEQV